MLNEAQEKALNYIWSKGTLFIPKCDIKVAGYTLHPYNAFRLYKLDLNEGAYLGLDLFTYNQEGHARRVGACIVTHNEFFELLQYCDVNGGKL